MNRAQSSLLEQPKEAKMREAERKEALLDAAQREAKAQAELWARFRCSSFPPLCNHLQQQVTATMS